MPIEVEFDGTVHEFPDDFTDAEIAAALGGGPPKVSTPPPPNATIGMMAPSTMAGDPAVPGSRYGGIGSQRVRTQLQSADQRAAELRSETAEHPYRFAGEVALAAAPTMASKVPGIIAKGLGISKARAGQNIQAAADAARTAVVNPAAPIAAGTEAMKFKGIERIPQVVRTFMTRTADPAKGDLTFEEGRRFYSAMSRMSVNEFNSLTPQMQRLVGDMRVALNQALTESAETVGKGAQYIAGMKEYARAGAAAKKWEAAKPVITTLARRMAEAAGLGWGATAAYQVFRD